MRTIWIGANKDVVWVLEHEADYEEGDSLVKISADTDGSVNVIVKRPHQQERVGNT